MQKRPHGPTFQIVSLLKRNKIDLFLKRWVTGEEKSVIYNKHQAKMVLVELR